MAQARHLAARSADFPVGPIPLAQLTPRHVQAGGLAAVRAVDGGDLRGLRDEPRDARHGENAGGSCRRCTTRPTVLAIGAEALVDPVAAVEALRQRGHELILSEGGPTAFGALVAAGLVDELFLTTSPLLAGRSPGSSRPGLVENAEFLPGTTVECTLLTLRHAGSQLFLRYQLSRPEASLVIVTDGHASKWVSQRREVGARPDRRALAQEASSSVMMKTPFHSRDARGRVNQEATSDRAFALTASALSLAMLTLFAVLALADVVGLTHMLPFLALPPALLVASAFFLWRWTTGEAEASAVQEVAHRKHEKGRQ